MAVIHAGDGPFPDEASGSGSGKRAKHGEHGEKRNNKVTPLHNTHESVIFSTNPEAERNLLGSISIATGEEEVESALDLLRPADFADARHRVICEAMQALRDERKPAGDVVLLDEWLRQRNQLSDAGGQAYISSLANHVITSSHAHEYARILVRLGVQRNGMQEMSNFFVGAGQPEAFDGGSFEALWHALATRMETQLDRLAEASPDADEGYTAADLMQMELPEPRWIVPGILPVGLSLLAAKQKIGKSWWSLSVGLAVALGGRALGVKEVEGGDVLYLALEDNKLRMQSRIRQLLQGAQPPHRLHIAHKWPRFDLGGYRKIEHWLRERDNPRLVIIDVLAKVRTPRAKHGDIYAEDYALMTPLQDLAYAYNVSIVVIHHTRKASAEDVFDEIRDSAGLSAACDAVMVLQRPRNDDNAILHITGRDVDEAQLALKLDKASGQWNLLGDAQEFGMSEARRAIITLLREAKRPMTPMHIAESLGKNVSTVRNLLVSMREARQVINKFNGTYSIDSIDSVDAMDYVDAIDATASRKSMESMHLYNTAQNAQNADDGARSALYAWAKRNLWKRIRRGDAVLIEGTQNDWELWLRSHDTATVTQLWRTIQRSD